MAVLIDSLDNIIYAPDMSMSPTIWNATCAKRTPQAVKVKEQMLATCRRLFCLCCPRMSSHFMHV